MSYSTIHQCANDEAFLARLQAAAAQEGEDNPEFVTSTLLRWPVSSATDVAAAYESAVIAGNENPGGDPAVITDAMILAKVQATLPPAP
jgi:hypothetical protein